MKLIDKARKTVSTYRMLSPGDRVVVAVSGGPDSVCLLRALLALAPEYGLKLHVAHLDHRFRGSESAAEARFVDGLAKKLGIPATIESRDVPAYCAERGLSAQAGARAVRYQFLQDAAGAVGAQRIALGHTANDQAETLLMRLIRGAGSSGLSAIPPVRDAFIRPLIDSTRTEVLAYLDEIGQDFTTDPSNVNPVYTRNRVRQEVLPVLERFNPRVVEALTAAADVLRSEDAAMESALVPVLERVLHREGDTVRIDRTAFNSLLPALQRRVLRKALACCVSDSPPTLSWIQTEEALGFMKEAKTGRSMELPGGLAFTREYDNLIIGPRRSEPAFCVRLAVPGTTDIPALALTVVAEVRESPSRAEGDAEQENYLWQAQFDYAKIALPLYLRNRRPGDWFCPAGMHGMRKKLQDFFVDEKVPRHGRAYAPLLATEQDLVWIVGMRTDGRFQSGPGTQTMLVVTIGPPDAGR